MRLLVVLVVAAAASAAASAARGEHVVSLDGAAGVRPGMSVDAVSRAWHVPLRPHGDAGCRAATADTASLAAVALFDRRRFGAVFYTRGAVASGVRIGSSTAAVRRAFGRVETQPDKYVAGARALYVHRGRQPDWQLRFDVSRRGRVTRIGFGGPMVRLAELCG
jgi:hypothetical protein